MTFDLDWGRQIWSKVKLLFFKYSSLSKVYSLKIWSNSGYYWANENLLREFEQNKPKMTSDLDWGRQMWFKVKFQIGILVLPTKSIFPESSVKIWPTLSDLEGGGWKSPSHIPDVENKSLDILGLKYQF